MTDDLQGAVQAMRAEFQRQAEVGDASYHGVAKDGLDGLEGYFDLTKIARAVLDAISPP
jgi:hypothetical protein